MFYSPEKQKKSKKEMKVTGSYSLIVYKG